MSCRATVNPPQPPVVARVELRSVRDLKRDVVTFEPQKDDVPLIIIYRPESP